MSDEKVRATCSSTGPHGESCSMPGEHDGTIVQHEHWTEGDELTARWAQPTDLPREPEPEDHLDGPTEAGP